MPLIGSTNVKGFCKQRHILKLKWVLIRNDITKDYAVSSNQKWRYKGLCSFVQSEMTLQRMCSRIVYFFIPCDLSFYWTRNLQVILLCCFCLCLILIHDSVNLPINQTQPCLIVSMLLLNQKTTPIMFPSQDTQCKLCQQFTIASWITIATNKINYI